MGSRKAFNAQNDGAYAFFRNQYCPAHPPSRQDVLRLVINLGDVRLPVVIRRTR
jgi:hypothetical protein